MTAEFPRVSTGQTLADISAEAFNNMAIAAENAQRTMGGNGALVRRVGPHVTVLTRQERARPAAAALAIRRFTIVNRDKNGDEIGDAVDGQTPDYLTCQPYDPSQEIIYEATSDLVQATKKVVKVWKPFGLREIDYRDYIRVLTDDRTVKFRKVNEKERQAVFENEPLRPREKQLITPAYQPGIQVIAIKRGPQLVFAANGKPEDEAIEWMELNNGRWWASAFAGTDEECQQ